MWHLPFGLYLSSCRTSRQMKTGVEIKPKQEAVTARPPKSGDHKFILDMKTPT